MTTHPKPGLSQKDLDHVLDHSRDAMEELRGSRIFITGGTGFFGKWLLESLLWANEHLHLDCRATVLTRDVERFKTTSPHLAGHHALSLLQGDVRSFKFPGGAFSHVIHAATESSEKLNVNDPLLMLDTIVAGTRNALDFAASSGAEKFLLTSSGAVYGKQPPAVTHLTEDYIGGPNPLDPRSAYGEGKRIAEHLCALYASPHLQPKIARCFTFVGPYLALDIHFAVGNFIRDALNGGPIIVKGDGTTIRSYMYMADLSVWLWTILLRGEPLRPYNVGSDRELSIAELAQYVAEASNPPIDIRILGTPAINQSIQRYVPSIHRSQRELELSVWISLQDGIARTIEHNST